ncbi:MAG TPA: GAF domain-containing SpoIIE family protein phosphatase [Anaerolineaceae bacterium]|nr:GAF domain-containing SpoIIE family protein phosphatase [Anaerolineaceae bacterium]
MTAFSLSRLLKPNGDFYRLTCGILQGLAGAGIAILDLDGRLLAGSEPQDGRQRYPVWVEDQVAGWVAGGDPAAAVAAWISYAAGQEAQKKSMAAELIDRYRELNLLYHLSEHLVSSPDTLSISKVALAEAVRMIPAATAILLSRPSGQEALEKAAVLGQDYAVISSCCLIDRVLQSGRAELANAVSAEDYFDQANGRKISLACAPLKTEKSIQGVILLVDSEKRVFSAGELKLLNAIGLQIAPALEISRLWQLAIEKAKIEREFQMARRVQESLLPRAMPRFPGWSIGNRWRPARNVSGDFYDLIREDQRLGLVIADVTDKGLPAALFMVFIRSAIRSSVNRGSPLAEEISQANRLICQDSHQGLLATMFYARLSPDTGEMEYVNAGHNPPLYYNAQKNQLQLLARTGVTLGMDAHMSYTSQTIHLLPGDMVLFYTDGVTEAINAAKEQFGLDRLMEVVYQLRACPVEQLLDGVDEALADFTQSLPSFDDITLLALKRL